jgi:hypothetical protein
MDKSVTKRYFLKSIKKTAESKEMCDDRRSKWYTSPELANRDKK